jgi:hypothetical protein
VNEVEPQPEDALDGATLIPGSPRGPGFSAPRETASNGVGSASGSFDIMDLGASEPGLSGCPRAPLLPASWKQVVGRGCVVDVLVCCDHMPTLDGEVGHGRPGCLTTGPGQS